MKKPQKIPIFLLDEMTERGIVITQFVKDSHHEVLLKEAHRDDHFIFIFQQQGHSRIMVDFKETVILGCAMMCILPGQVHQGVSADDTIAWLIAVDSAFIKDSTRHIFEQNIFTENVVAVESSDSAVIDQGIKLLAKVLDQSNRNNLQAEINRALTDACVGMIAQAFYKPQDFANADLTRPIMITQQFKRILLEEFKTEKMPSGYAELLNISAPYLNEVVKKVTGFSVSYWIQQQVIIEAKRILFYTESSVKEIADILGYEDQNYFSRLFSKIVGQSPVSFRNEYRK